MKSLNGRIAELFRVHQNDGIEIVYANTGFIAPNYWVSSAIINDFLESGLLERKKNKAKLTPKGIQKLQERATR